MTSEAMLNPLSQGLRLERTPEPCSVVIFGASGDLTRRKLIPALFSLARQNLLPAGFAVVGASRTPYNHDDFRAKMREALFEFADVGPGEQALLESFVNGLFYTPTDPSKPESVQQLKALLGEIGKERGIAGNQLFYLSTPPSLYAPICLSLGAAGLNRSQGWTRIIIEKPFGHDLESMRDLNRQVLSVFEEDQVYRIDHYLGKETVQNIMVLRFSNTYFEPLWNHKYIEHVQITAAESLGVEKRGGYYEQAGALRDMIQNHLFQIFSMVAMEPPVSLESNDIRDEKNKVVKAIRPFSIDQVPDFAQRGQYGSGAINGEPVPGYRQEDQVNLESNTDTYAAVKLVVDNWRWAGTPFYLRSGKRLPKRVSEIAIRFKQPPQELFGKLSGPAAESNALVIHVQPDEGITMKFRAKLPGPAMHIRNVNMDFDYGASFGKKSPEAYERLQLDAMLGDSTLFARGDMVEASWELMSPILEAWQEPAGDAFPNYEAGTWGPSESDNWLARADRQWRRP